VQRTEEEDNDKGDYGKQNGDEEMPFKIIRKKKKNNRRKRNKKNKNQIDALPTSQAQETLVPAETTETPEWEEEDEIASTAKADTPTHVPEDCDNISTASSMTLDRDLEKNTGSWYDSDLEVLRDPSTFPDPEDIFASESGLEEEATSSSAFPEFKDLLGAESEEESVPSRSESDEESTASEIKEFGPPILEVKATDFAALLRDDQSKHTAPPGELELLDPRNWEDALAEAKKRKVHAEINEKERQEIEEENKKIQEKIKQERQQKEKNIDRVEDKNCDPPPLPETPTVDHPAQPVLPPFSFAPRWSSSTTPMAPWSELMYVEKRATSPPSPPPPGSPSGLPFSMDERGSRPTVKLPHCSSNENRDWIFDTSAQSPPPASLPPGPFSSGEEKPIPRVKLPEPEPIAEPTSAPSPPPTSPPPGPFSSDKEKPIPRVKLPEPEPIAEPTLAPEPSGDPTTGPLEQPPPKITILQRPKGSKGPRALKAPGNKNEEDKHKDKDKNEVIPSPLEETTAKDDRGKGEEKCPQSPGEEKTPAKQDRNDKIIDEQKDGDDEPEGEMEPARDEEETDIPPHPGGVQVFMGGRVYFVKYC